MGKLIIGLIALLLAAAAAWWFLREQPAEIPVATEESAPSGDTSARNPAALDALAEGMQLQARADYTGALEAYDRALALDPALRGVTYQRGVARFQLGEHTAAVELLGRSIAAGEEAAAAHLLLGVIAAKEKDYDTAEAEFARVLELTPEEAQAHYNLGEMRRAQGRPAEAVDHYRQAVRANPQEPLFAFKLRLARVEAGAGAAVEAETREQLALEAPTGDWLMTAAAINLQRNETAEAAKMLGYAAAAMQPQMFFAMLQDPAFATHAEEAEIRPFYQVEVLDGPPPEDAAPDGAAAEPVR